MSQKIVHISGPDDQHGFVDPDHVESAIAFMQQETGYPRSAFKTKLVDIDDVSGMIAELMAKHPGGHVMPVDFDSNPDTPEPMTGNINFHKCSK